jgi:hypothetical protein
MGRTSKKPYVKAKGQTLEWIHIFWKVGYFRKLIGGFQNYLCEVASRSAAA